jgi:hypothetical protein
MGATALRDGRYDGAERLLIDARKRDPRYGASRFLLAETFLDEQKILPGLRELVVLSRISPQLMPAVATALAAYSHTPGAVPRLRQALRGNPEIENALLAFLANDARNARLILSLASGRKPSNGLTGWQQELLASLVKSGDPRDAVALWQQFTARAVPDVGDFSDSSVASPFTWNLASSSGGAAIAHGRMLDVQFFGEADTSLASKTVVLAPGQYRLQFKLTHPPSDRGSVHFVAACVPDGRKLLDAPIASAAAGPAARFEVPERCQAQVLSLIGFAEVFPAETDFSIADLNVLKL